MTSNTPPPPKNRQGTVTHTVGKGIDPMKKFIRDSIIVGLLAVFLYLLSIAVLPVIWYQQHPCVRWQMAEYQDGRSEWICLFRKP